VNPTTPKLFSSSPVTATQNERRLHPRVGAPDLPLHLGDDSNALFRVRDVSQSGAAFFAEEPIPVMTKVRFSFALPTADGQESLIQGEGAVVRCARLAPAIGHYEVAIFFQDLAPDCQEAIEAFINQALAS
jgi:hypothetical protein